MSYQPNLRDRLVHRTANAVIRLGTKPYRQFLTAIVLLGREEFDRLAHEQTPAADCGADPEDKS